MKKNIIILVSVLSVLLVVTLFVVLIGTPSDERAVDIEAPVAEPERTADIETPAVQPVTDLRIWMPPFGGVGDGVLDKVFWEEALKPFAEENNIDVRVEIIPWGGYEERYMTAFIAGDAPDVGYMYMEMISDFIDAGALSPIDAYLTNADRENYIYLDKGVIRGQQFMLPIIVGNPRILFANMDILAKSGFTAPPKTWIEFIEMGKKIAEDSPNIFPFLQPWLDPAIGALNSMFYPFLWQAGGDIFTEDYSSVRFNDAAGLKAAQFLHDLIFYHKILPEVTTSLRGVDVERTFLESGVAMIIAGSTFVRQVDEAGINWDFVTSLTNIEGGTFIAADSLVLFSTSKNKVLAIEAMKLMTSSPVMAAFHKELAAFAPITRDGEFLDHPKLKRMYENDTHFFNTLPPVRGSFKIYENLYKNLQMMMLGQLTPEEALNASAEYAKTIMGQ